MAPVTATTDVCSSLGCPCPQRCLRLAGSYNLRDLGGHTTTTGRLTRWRTVLRSGNLDKLTDGSRRALLESGLATVIDLRDPSEVSRHPNAFARCSQVTYSNLPLVRIDSATWRAELNQRYVLMARECRTEIAATLGGIATSCAPMIVHCTAGKDRTGLIVAILLAFVGVPADAIAADYALSERCLLPFFARVRPRLEARGADLARFERDAKAPPETILQVLEYIETRYGGVGDYLRLPARLEQRLTLLMTV